MTTVIQALGWYFPESLGGTEIYVRALARRLRYHGYRVAITAPDSRISEEHSYEVEGVEVFRYPIPAFPNRAQSQGLEPVPGVRALHRWLERKSPAIFHCHSLVTGLGLDELKVAKRFGARVIVTLHTPGLGYVCQRGTMMRWGRELCDGLAAPGKCTACVVSDGSLLRPVGAALSKIPLTISRRAGALPGRLGTALGLPALIEHNVARERELVETADAIVVLTEWARGAVAATVGSYEKLILNRLGIEPDNLRTRAARTPRRGPLKLGYLGRFDRIKGVVELARAVARFPPALPVSVEFRGPEPSEDERVTLSLVRRILRGDARVRFEPAVPPDRVGEILAGYDALICPAICLEGGPTVALEAHGVGTPVIGTRIGGLGEIIEDGVSGRLVTPGDPAALAAAIEEVVAAPQKTLAVWRNALPAPRTMDAVADDYLSLYGRASTPESEKCAAY